MDDDARLVAGLRASDEAAAMEVLDLYSASMLRIAAAVVRSQALAEDVVQETWLAVLKGIHRFQMRSSLRTWIFRILLNKARTQAARNRRLVLFSELPAGDPVRAPARDDPEARALSAESLSVTREAIDTLPPTQSAVIVLRDLQGWPAEEVSAVLRLSRGNQRVLLHRARGRVRSTLDEYLSGAA
jgi:RNA polymerase sigma-70 factor (ECF subfamily)